MPTRKQMLHEYKILNDLSAKPLEWVLQNYKDNLASTMEAGAKLSKEGGACKTKKTLESFCDKLKLLKNPPFHLVDNIDWIIYNEKRLLGIAITAHSTDVAQSEHEADTSCKDFANGKSGLMTFLVEIKQVKEILTKNKDKMAFLTIEDSTCLLSDVCVFSKQYEEFAGLLYEGAIVFLIGEKDKKKGSLIVKNIIPV